MSVAWSICRLNQLVLSIFSQPSQVPRHADARALLPVPPRTWYKSAGVISTGIMEMPSCTQDTISTICNIGMLEKKNQKITRVTKNCRGNWHDIKDWHMYILISMTHRRSNLHTNSDGES
jgi:hypothetical protein